MTGSVNSILSSRSVFILHVGDYARVFLAMANYQEIADTINEDIEINEHLTNKK